MPMTSLSCANRGLFIRASLIAMVLALLPCLPMRAQAAVQTAAAAPPPLITQAVDESQLTTLKGNTHPLARPQFDLGTAPSDLPMARMLLVLKRSAEQESAVRKLLDDQQDKASPNYHKWLTPEQYGQQFGPTDADLQTITAWLQSHGFQVGSTKGRTVLEFSGTAGQVQEAFHTTIHKYIVNGEQHWANASDPQIPTALTPAVAGVLTLHNFLKRPQIHLEKQPVLVKTHPGQSPDLDLSNGTHALAPADYATIYNINPVYGYSVNSGLGATIGVVGRSNLYNGANIGVGQDVEQFRDQFIPCCAVGSFEVVLNGPDPGDLGGSEEAEATLDTSWPGAVATGAVIDLVVSASTNTADGSDLSEVYIIEYNLGDVMTESFSSCEANSTTSNAAGVAGLAEQAAAQGITYVVATGDSGAEGCDNPSTETVASGPVSVNLLASTPFNTAVGGTIFNENGQNSVYWSSANNNNESALSYIPEDAWNESCTAGTCSGADSPAIWAGGGGASIFFDKPSWQAGVTGIPSDGVRDLPDVSLSAASHDPYVLCLENSCATGSQGQFYVYLVSGTSAATPSFAGVMALVDNKMGVAGQGRITRQGQANYVLYRLAASQTANLSQCNASNTSDLPASTCVFNDVTVGNNAVPGELNYGLSTADYQTGIGYDLATGLGSVNVTNLVNQWNSVTFSPTSTSLMLNNNSAVNVVHGQSVSVNVSVTPNSGTGTPTGSVSLLTNTNQSFGGYTLNGGQIVDASTNVLGGGSYQVYAHYAGDGAYAPSDSGQVPVTVTAEPSTTSLSVLTFNSQGIALPFTSGTFGSNVYLRADVAGQSGHGTPTGTVTFADTFGPIPGGNSFALNGGDILYNGSNAATPNGVISFAPGTHTISSSYSGDNSFDTSNSTPPITFTITPGFFAAIPSAQSAVVISLPGGSGTTSVSVSNSTGFSGTISLACSGLPSETTCTFTPTTIAANGTANTSAAVITVTTTAAASARSQRGRYQPAVWMSMGLCLSVVLLSGKRQRTRGTFLLLTLMLVVVAPSCGGGGSGGAGNQGPPPNAGTPTGTSTVVVTATSASTVSTAAFTLVVQ
jgi:hypothetical protein